MSKREVVKTLLQGALASMSKTTLIELRNIESLAREARAEERSDAYTSYNEIDLKLESFPDFKEAKNRVITAEQEVAALRAEYRPKYEKEDEERMNGIKEYWDSLIWEINVAEVRKQQMLRAKATDKEKKGRK